MKSFHWSSRVTLASFLILFAFLIYSVHNYQASHAASYIASTTPTFFFHGTNSSYHAEEYMTHGATKAGISNDIVIADVKKSGQVKFSGTIRTNDRNPIIEVNYENNNVWGHPESFHIDGDYAYDAISAATRKWHFKSMNLVGHSMGNIDIVFMLLDHGNDPSLPKLEKEVSIAGHYNGGYGFGYPKGGTTLNQEGLPNREEQNFTALKALRHTYPHGVKVLNIYGDVKDGTHSDGEVPVNSAKTLKYLVQPNAASYQEKEITGHNAAHSKLHHNPTVNKIIYRFLWGQ